MLSSILFASGILFFGQQKPNNIQHFAMQEIKTPAGVRSQVVLPDGTHVWLNAESTIKFKVPFDQRSRDITLQGEAFFDVFKDPDIPFIVNSGSVNVKVLGTRFNCKAYADEQHLEVVLAEGMVSLNTNGNQTGDAVIMKPGDRAVYDKTTNQTSFTNGSVAKYIEWHNGKLIFDETPMPEVAIELGRWFGVEILINDAQIRNYKLTTTFENESLHQILELIKLSSPVEVQYVAATINKANLKQTKARVIFSKKTTNKN
jgi:ferric-dicitrate binding protein FerR (iron transport regulator)